MGIDLKAVQALDLWRGAIVESVRREAPDLSARQMALLLTVYLSPPPHTVRGLALALNVSKPAVTRALDRLSEFGLVRRKVDEDDRRSVLIQRTVKGRKTAIGNNVQAEVTKNKLTGKRRVIEFPLYYDYGIDDIASCVDFLCECEEWSSKDGKLLTNTIGLESTTVSAAIKEIEEKGLLTKLYSETERVWVEIEEKLKLNRKAKYQ